ncbi:unnamed protein product [Litomosoides sigmodontis]|uniref:Fatty-acid and retinol-binding protein 1 n=1 Tax=Litomosoides sigmodontis TaxID=42156 RepID=A0A3P6S3G6_LITSI|nr:unnamed protein product [Litomosoides sigmodontis]
MSKIFETKLLKAFLRLFQQIIAIALIRYVPEISLWHLLHLQNSAGTSRGPRSLQQELRAFYNNLDEEERLKLKKYTETGALDFSDGQFLDILKNEAGGFLAKLIGLRNIISDKLDTMQPESRQFIENILKRFLVVFSRDGLMNILDDLKDFAKEIIDKFDELPQSAQDDVLKAFPTIGSYATNDITRFILRNLAKVNFTTKTSSTFSPSTDDERGDSDAQFKNSRSFGRDGRKGSLRSATNSLTDNEELPFKKVIATK